VTTNLTAWPPPFANVHVEDVDRQGALPVEVGRVETRSERVRGFKHATRPRVTKKALTNWGKTLFVLDFRACSAANGDTLRAPLRVCSKDQVPSFVGGSKWSRWPGLLPGPSCFLRLSHQCARLRRGTRCNLSKLIVSRALSSTRATWLCRENEEGLLDFRQSNADPRQTACPPGPSALARRGIAERGAISIIFRQSRFAACCKRSTVCRHR